VGLPAKGRFRAEVIFFHKESRTLILTDFIENFERRMIDSWFVRFVVGVGGLQDPCGGMPRDIRLTRSICRSVDHDASRTTCRRRRPDFIVR
jgi:hypothetical protein